MTRMPNYTTYFAIFVAVAATVAAIALATSPTAAGTPLPAAPACTIFPADNPWNQRVDALPVASGSGRLVRNMGLTRLHPDFSDSDADGYGIPFNVVGADTPKSQVTYEYDDESDTQWNPIPTNPKIESGSDRHLLMLDRDACKLYELFAAQTRGGMWHAGSGAVFDLTSNALRPAGWTSADAAGLPIFPGLARYDEVAGGGIDHALRVTIPTSQRAYLWPARHYASSNVDPSQGPMGLRLRVKASYDISRHGPQTRAVLLAAQRYGLIVADNGSAGYISGAPDPGWNDDDLHSLHDVPATAFEVVDTSTLPGHPKVRRVWNQRARSARNGTTAVQGYVTRTGFYTATAVRDGKVVRSKRVRLRQGFASVTLRSAAGARYRLRAS